MPRAEPALSPEATRLIVRCLRDLLQPERGLIREFQEAIARQGPPGIADDPALLAEIELSNAAIFAQWFEGMASDPRLTVVPILPPVTLRIIEDIARRGLDDVTSDHFRAGFGVVSRHIVELACARSADTRVIAEALTALLASGNAYVEASVAAIRDEIARHRTVRGTAGVRRLDLARQLLEGTLTDSAVASAQLGFELDRELVAVVAWVDAQSAQGIEPVSRMLAATASALLGLRPLVVEASATSVWAWLPTDIDGALRIAAAVAPQTPAARFAVGDVGRGAEGVRRGHAAAAAVQRMVREFALPDVIVTHRELRVLAMLGRDRAASQQFVTQVLGPLAEAPAELHETLRASIEHGFDTAEVARRLAVHRNTVLGRVRRARELLGPNPTWTEVGLALELHRRLGAGGQ